MNSYTELSENLRFMCGSCGECAICKKHQEVLDSAADIMDNLADDGWVSVKDRLPAWLEDQLCLVVIPEDGGKARHTYKVLHTMGAGSDKWNCTGMIVTHWRPIPAPPEGGIEL